MHRKLYFVLDSPLSEKLSSVVKLFCISWLHPSLPLKATTQKKCHSTAFALNQDTFDQGDNCWIPYIIISQTVSDVLKNIPDAVIDQ